MVKISQVSIFAIICALVTATSYGASSVRSMSGAVSSDMASGVSASNTVAPDKTSSGLITSEISRGSSVRINPATTKVSTATPHISDVRTSGRVATTPRLSIGKYLGTSPVVSGVGTSIGSGVSGGGAIGGVASELRNDVDELQRSAELVKSELDTKQNTLITTDDGYIVIDKTTGEISVDVEHLTDALRSGFVSLGADDPIELGTDPENGDLLWHFVGENEWRTLATSADVVDSAIDAAIERVDETIQTAIQEAFAEVYSKSDIDKLLLGKADKTDLDELRGTVDTLQANTANAGDVDELLDIVGDEELDTTAQTLTGAVNEVAGYILPRPGPVCNSPSNLCVLSVDNDRNLVWVAVAGGADESRENSNTLAVRVETGK